MTKKLLYLVMTVAMMCSLFVISTNASVATSKNFVDESFTLPEGEDGTIWRPEGWTVGPRHGLAETIDLGTYVITEEGYAKVCKGGYTGGACVAYKFPTLPDEYTLMFDVRYPETSGYTGTLYVDCSINGYKQNVQPNGNIAYADDVTGEAKNIGAGGHDPNTWYTYVFQIKGDRMSVYRKSEKESAFALKVDNKKMLLRDGAEFYAYSTSPTAFINIDNVKVFSGTYMTESNITVNDDKSVITGTMSVTSAKANPVQSSLTTAVMTAYDAKGKVIDMVFENVDLAYDDANDFTVEMPITPDVYEKLSGGTIELYLWDSFAGLSPQTAAYVIDVQ